MKSRILIATVVVLILCATPIFVGETDAGGSPITVTDGTGNTIELDGIPNQVIGVGVGVNATLIGLGVADKIVVCDNYSITNTSSELDVLDQMKEDGKIMADGNVYSSGKENLLGNCVYSVDKGFNLENDLVLITASKTYADPIVSYLKDKGFKNIATWYDVKTYEDLADYIKAISMLTTGKVDGELEEMLSLPESISRLLGSTEKRDAMYVTYSSSVFKVNDKGSIAGTMIEAAGGNTFTVKNSGSSTYETNIPNLFANGAHSNAVVFVDQQIMDKQDLLSNLRNQLPDTVKVVGLKGIWNNFSIESLDGIEVMAQAMYPEIFGDLESGDTGSDDNYLYYGIAIVVALVLISACYFFLVKKR